MSAFTPDLFVKPVDGQEDVFAFRFDFGVAPEGKAQPDSVSIDDASITELEDGDLLIAGWAANFEGIDRQNENFTDGAFKRGIKSFLSGTASLNFHHKHDHGIGRVLKLEEVEGKGLYMEARVDRQEPTSPLYYIYNGIRKGSYKGLSVGGFFKRLLTPNGWRIGDVDFTEISVTPVPVHAGTGFGVVAGKALEDVEIPTKPQVEGDVREEDVRQIKWMVEELNGLFARISKRGEGLDEKATEVDSDL